MLRSIYETTRLQFRDFVYKLERFTVLTSTHPLEILVNALLLTRYGGPETTAISSISTPEPGPNQVLVRVKAAGINGLDWKVREGYVRDAFPLQLPTVLGLELAGTVERAGPGASRFRVGDRVMGPLGGLGAYAELVAVDEGYLCRIPDGLGAVEAAALPVAAVSAWQSSNAVGPIQHGQRVLIHGAAGGLGGFAVQFAKQAGATVVATARGRYAGYLRGLGADQVVDYETQRFDEVVKNVDLVLDYVGGDVLDRSWKVLSERGAIVSTTSPDISKRTPAGRRGVWFVNKPDTARLESIARDVAAGRLRSQVSEVVAFNDLPAAIERNRTQPHQGKVIVEVA
jgi:NADPH:quinone reductase-like Zn-dependent oxidoreductase